MNSEYSLYEKAAEEALRVGEQVLLKKFKPDKIAKTAFKAHREFVTAADLASNAAIQRVLAKLAPDVDILSEEGSLRKPKVLQTHLQWVLDPLDGTTNYTIGLPLWGISLALLKDGVPIRGWIRLPLLKERYLARLNEGAWKNGKRFHLVNARSMKDGVGLLCHGYREEEKAADIQTIESLMRESYTTRRLGSACVELAWVATGRASYLVIYGAKPWDLAAGTLLITEAGGFVSTPVGDPWKPSDPDCVAGGPASFPQVIDALKRT